MKLAVSEARVMTPHNSREKTAVHTPYFKMAEILVFLSLCAYLPLLPRLRENIFSNLDFKNNASRANLQENKRALIWRPLWNKMDKRLFFLLSCVES